MEELKTLTHVPRTEGDGMESLSAITQEPCGTNTIITSTSQLKSSERIINVIPKVTLPISTSKPINNLGNEKNTKFVPYEPYKAATKPIIPNAKKKKNPASTAVDVSSFVQSDQTAFSDCCNSLEVNNLKREIEKLKKENAEITSELKLQGQVNAELKKLLVASVGEDMEARVHFLTEDKAKLAEDICRYVEKIAIDFEQKEKLAIEADIWRSKFLASSVVIEELAKWKSVLCTRNDELQTCVRSLLEEMDSVYKSQMKIFKQLNSMSTVFDPLPTASSKAPEIVSGDVLDVSRCNLSLAETLSKRLLGSFTQIREDNQKERTVPEKLTAAQSAAREMLTKNPAISCLMSELTSEATAHKVSSLARRSQDKSQFTCCPHCTGEVKTV